jgi:N-acetylmuramic acid 6-phosphate etherase
VQALNEKLVLRSESMLRQLTDRSSDEVRDALRQAKGSVKLAALLLHGCDLAEATAILDRTGGRLREAIALADKRHA